MKVLGFLNENRSFFRSFQVIINVENNVDIVHDLSPFLWIQILLDTYILTDINKTSRAVPDVLINSSQLHVSLYIFVSFLVMTVVIG